MWNHHHPQFQNGKSNTTKGNDLFRVIYKSQGKNSRPVQGTKAPDPQSSEVQGFSRHTYGQPIQPKRMEGHIIHVSANSQVSD